MLESPLLHELYRNSAQTCLRVRPSPGVPSEDPRLAAEEEGLDQVGRSVPTRERLIPLLLDRPTIEEVLEGEGEIQEIEMEPEEAPGSAARGAAPAEPEQPAQEEAEQPARGLFPWDLPPGIEPEAAVPAAPREKRPARSRSPPHRIAARLSKLRIRMRDTPMAPFRACLEEFFQATRADVSAVRGAGTAGATGAAAAAAAPAYGEEKDDFFQWHPASPLP